MRQICRYLPVLALVPFCVSLANAQSAVDFNFGFGGAWDSAGKSGIDFNSSTGACTAAYPTDVTCQATKALSGFMLGFGGDVLFKPKLGFGIDVAVQPALQSYAPVNASTSALATSVEEPVQSRETFYDFDAVYRPITTKRAALNILGGIGGARTSFSVTQSGCLGTAVCSSQTSPIGTSSHFQAHIGVGVMVFITDHLYVKPEFDVHIVSGLTDQYNSNFVPAAMVWVGYNLGSK